MVKLNESSVFDIARYILSLGRGQKNYKNIPSSQFVLNAPNARVPFLFRESFVTPQLRSAAVLRSSGLLLHRGAEDQHVEGGSWLGQSTDIHLCPLVSRGHGGAADSPGGAEETQS